MTEQIMSKGIQCRVQNSDYHIHIQAIGPIETNRPYGGAWELRAPVEVVEWCGEQSPIYKSAASTGIYYVRMDVLMFETGAQALLIHGEEFNHPKGLMMGCNPKSPAVKAVIEYAYQTDLMSDAVFNDKVSEIVLEEAPVMLEETDTQTMAEALNLFDPSQEADKMVSDSEDDFGGGVPIKCKTCGGKMDVVTPAYCALCEKETHGGATVVWCVDCNDPVTWHLQHECEAYCPLGPNMTGCDMPKPCLCTLDLESDEGEEE